MTCSANVAKGRHAYLLKLFVLMIVVLLVVQISKSTLSNQQPLVTDKTLTALRVDDYVGDLVVEEVRTVHRPRIGDIITHVGFRGELTVTGEHDQIGAHQLLFFVVPKEQLPFAEVEYVSSYGGCLSFDDDATAKRMLSPKGLAGHATIVIDNLNISYPETQGCTAARLIKVLQD